VFENKALRKVFDPNRKQVTRGRIKLRNEELVIYRPTPHPVTTGMKSRRIGRGMRHVGRRRDMHTGFLSEDLNIYMKPPERSRSRWRDNSEMDLCSTGG
jgi:hypothetical protein